MEREVRVLHVDDDRDFASLTAAFLERELENVVVQTAADPERGAALIDSFDPDCVVSDFDMPGSNGIEFLERVREEEPDLPFILFTGKGSEEVASEAISADVTDYLQKGTDSSQYAVLANRIENAVDQYRAERDLERERHRYNALFENVAVPIVYFEYDAGEAVIEDVNPAFEEAFGWSVAEAGGEPLDEVVVPTRLYDEGKDISRRTREGEVVSAEVVRQTADGDERPFHILSVPLAPGESGDGGFALYSDVTERAERERVLAALHERTDDLFRATDREAVARVTVETAAETMDFPFSAVRLVDESGTHLEPVAVTEGARELLGERPVYEVGEGTAGRAFEAGETLVVEDLSSLEDGYERGGVGSAFFVPIGSHGTLSVGDTTPGSFEDSDRHMAEILAANAVVALDRLERERELKRQNERLERFASVLSHDLKSPLSVALGRLEMIEDDSERVDPVETALERMAAMIDDVLALTREGRTVDDVESIALPEMARACWETVQTDGTSLAVDATGDIVADPGRLPEVFENLFANCAEHAGSGATVRVDDLQDGFVVEDDGPGIDAEPPERIFEYGYSTSRSGTGVGLSIVKEIAEAHGWSVAVAENDAGGARFEFHEVSRP